MTVLTKLNNPELRFVLFFFNINFHYFLLMFHNFPSPPTTDAFKYLIETQIEYLGHQKCIFIYILFLCLSNFCRPMKHLDSRSNNVKGVKRKLRIF